MTSADLGSLFNSEGDRIFSFLYSRCGSRSLAEDLTAETFVSASRKFAAGGASEVTPGWLVTVAKRRLIDHWRSQAAQHRRFDRLVEQARQGAATTAPEQTRVDEALSSLSERHRAALVLRYIEDMSVSEVADALGLTYRGAESLLGRARSAFARSFEGRS